MKPLMAFIAAWLTGLVCLASSEGAAATADDMFADPMLRRCIFWLLTGTQGALIEPLCTDEYQIPPPSLFLCARKVLIGFQSQTDLDACAVVFDEEARKVRSGYIRRKLPPGM